MNLHDHDLPVEVRFASHQAYVVDDDDALRAELCELLRAKGVRARAFRSGDEFIAELPDLSPGCVLLDLRMPGADGLTVLERVFEARGSHQVVMLSGSGTVTQAVRALHEGAIDFIEKPADPQRLVGAVSKALRSIEEKAAATRERADATAKFASLAARELEVLRLALGGRQNKVIARALAISPRTVETHRARAMAKLQVRSLGDAKLLAMSAGLDLEAGSDRLD